jgi:uncharacterized protein YegL
MKNEPFQATGAPSGAPESPSGAPESPSGTASAASSGPPSGAPRSHLLDYYLVVDLSGSMHDQIDEVRLALNKHLDGLRERCSVPTGPKVRMSILQFNDRLSWWKEGVSPVDIPPVTEENFYVNGSTALLDAVGQTLERALFEEGERVTKERVAKTRDAQTRTPSEGAPQDRSTQDPTAQDPASSHEVLVMVFSDGGENASVKFSGRTLAQLMEKCQNRPGWTVTFTGCDPQALQDLEAQKMRQDRMVSFSMAQKGKALEFMSDFVLENLDLGGSFHSKKFIKKDRP